MGEERQVLAALALMGGVIFDQRQLELGENQYAGSVTEAEVLKINETGGNSRHL